VANRAQFRTGLRDLINDPAGSPLWNDSAANAAIADAVARYGAWLPVSAATTLSVVAGTTAYALPSAVAPDSPIELYDPEMRRIPPARSDQPTVYGAALEWYQASGTLYLTSKPTNDEDWLLIYQSGRACPTNDVDQLPVLAGHEPIIYELAAAQLVERRALDDAKHAQRAQMLELAKYHRGHAAELMNLYRRRARGGSVAT